jgi:hypothetical protein
MDEWETATIEDGLPTAVLSDMLGAARSARRCRLL